MRKMLAILTAGLAAVALMAASAQAAPLISYETTTEDGNKVTGTALFGFEDNANPPPDIYMTLLVTNTSADESIITAIAFDLPSGYANFSFDDTNGWVLETVVGGPLAGFDVCIATPTGSCTGGNPDTGVQAGSSLLFGFSFNSELTASEFQALTVAGYNDGTLNSIARFQQVGPDGEDSAFAPGTPVPEPATLAMLGLGLLGLAAIGRRKRGLKS